MHGPVHSSVTWESFLKEVAHLMRYNSIIRQIKWESNHEYAELIHTMLIEL